MTIIAPIWRFMNMLEWEFWLDHLLIVLSVCAGIIFGISVFAENRRKTRNNLEAVGFMPWTAISVFSVMVALMAGALAYKS